VTLDTRDRKHDTGYLSAEFAHGSQATWVYFRGPVQAPAGSPSSQFPTLSFPKEVIEVAFRHHLSVKVLLLPKAALSRILTTGECFPSQLLEGPQVSHSDTMPIQARSIRRGVSLGTTQNDIFVRMYPDTRSSITFCFARSTSRPSVSRLTRVVRSTFH